MATSLIIINGVGFLNDHKFVVSALRYPLPIPDRTTLLFVSSIFLAIGSTIFKVACPSRIQEFSETQWVEQHGHPRLHYLAVSMSWRSWRRPAQWATAFFTLLGGLLALWLMIDSIKLAISYLIQYM